MDPIPPKALALAHALLADVVQPGDVAVDATAGNGHDTDFLARAVGSGGRVIALDIEPAAVAATRDRCAGAAARCEIVEADHASLGAVLDSLGVRPASVAAVVFNLGYLPGSDKSRVTRPDTTLVALAQAVDWLRPGGLVTIVCYSGHPGGADEARAVGDWAAGLPQERFAAACYRILNQRHHPPHLIAVGRRADPAPPVGSKCGCG